MNKELGSTVNLIITIAILVLLFKIWISFNLSWILFIIPMIFVGPIAYILTGSLLRWLGFWRY